MATESTMTLPIGTPAPDFALPDVISGKIKTLQDYRDAGAFLVVFLCRHCPYVVHVRDELIRLTRDWQPKGLAAIGISSNDARKYPDDAPGRLKEMALECQFPFSIVYDESQEVARAYTASCTPDFFLFDGEQKLAYRGRFDESTPGNGKPVTGSDLRAAIEAVLSGKPVSATQSPSCGCSIKWR
jgi:peroxiredoxin